MSKSINTRADEDRRRQAVAHGLRRMLTETELAELVGLSVAGIRNQRARKIGVPFVKFGRSVRYRAEDVETYINSRRSELVPAQAA